MTYRAPRLVVAIPTIPARRKRHAQVEAAWRRHTCQPIDVIFSEAGHSWGDGLNDIWAQVRDPAPSIFVCASDDVIPEDDNWLPPLLDHIARGVQPAPCLIDPRFTNYGGHLKPVPDGTESDMASVPVLAGMWGDSIFPVPEDLHYFCDNFVALKLLEAGIPCVAVPSSRLRHLWAEEGRGAGMPTEQIRMAVDSERYTEALAAMGIDRAELPKNLRGPLLS